MLLQFANGRQIFASRGLRFIALDGEHLLDPALIRIRQLDQAAKIQEPLARLGERGEPVVLVGQRLLGRIGAQRLCRLGQTRGRVGHQGLGVLYRIEEGLLIGARRRPLFERGEQSLIELSRPIRRVALIVS